MPPMNRWSFRLTLLVLPVLVYLNALDGPFVYDDLHSIADNPHIRQLRNVPRFFVEPELFSVHPANAMYRPLLLVTYAVNHAVSGSAVWSYHVVNVSLHALATLVLFFLGSHCLRTPHAAAGAALLFGLHPVNTETVNYISSRSELLAGLFVLLGLWAYLARRPRPLPESSQPPAPCFSGDALQPPRAAPDTDSAGRPVARRSWRVWGSGRPTWVVAALVCGLLAKSVAIVLPVLLAVHDLVCDRPALRRERRLYGAMALVGCVYLGVVWRFFRKAMVDAPVRPYHEQIWTQVKALVFYLESLVWPSALSVDHQFLVSTSPRDPVVVAALALMVSLGVLVWKGRAAHGMGLVSYGWTLVVLAPASLVPLNVLVNERRLYLPVAFFALSVAALLEVAVASGYRRQRVAGAALATLLCLGASTWQRNRVWADPLVLWSDAARKAPLMARPQLLKAQALADAGQAPAAVAALNRALARDPAFIPAYDKMAALLRRQGDFPGTEQALWAGIARDSTAVSLWQSLGELRQAQQRWAECAAAYARAAQLSSQDPAIWNNLGNAYQMLETIQPALAAHRRALELDPADPRTWLNLGNAYMTAGQLQQAIAAYENAIRHGPRYAPAWLGLGSARERSGAYGEAINAYRRGGRLDSRFEEFAAARVEALEGATDAP